jgi:hypothetical protein
MMLRFHDGVLIRDVSSLSIALRKIAARYGVLPQSLATDDTGDRVMVWLPTCESRDEDDAAVMILADEDDE